MAPRKANSIPEYKFEISLTRLRAVIGGNFLIGIIILCSELENVFSNPYAFFCLISGSLILLLHLFYNWRNSEKNLFVVIAYLSIYFVELFVFGVPEPIVKIQPQMSKGILLDFILLPIPYIYMTLRAALVIPLIQTYFAYRKIKNSLL